MKELTDRQRTALATAVAQNLCSWCWAAGVEQVAHEADGRVVIYPWKPGKFSDRELEVIHQVWAARASSAHIELVIAEHPGGGAFTKATP